MPSTTSPFLRDAARDASLVYVSLPRIMVLTSSHPSPMYELQPTTQPLSLEPCSTLLSVVFCAFLQRIWWSSCEGACSQQHCAAEVLAWDGKLLVVTCFSDAKNLPGKGLH